MVREISSLAEVLEPDFSLFFELAELIPYLVSIHKNAEFVYMNKYGLSMLGADSLEQIVGKSTRVIAHPDYQDELIKKMNQAEDSTEPVDIENAMLIDLKGNKLKVEFKVKSIKINDERYVISFVQDQTERIFNEKELQENKEKYRILSELTSDAATSLTVEQDGTLNRDWAIDNILKGYGYSFDDIDNFEKWAQIIYPEDLPIFYKGVEDIKINKQVSSELRILTKEGDIKWIHNSVYSYTDSITGKIKLLSSVKDITERKTAEENFRKADERLKIVVQNMPVMIIAFDENYKLAVWNNYCEKVTGYTKEEAFSMENIFFVLIPDTEKMNKLEKSWRNQKFGKLSEETDIVCKNGTVKTIQWTDISFEIPISGWKLWALGTDETERKQNESEREKLIMSLQDSMVDMEQKNAEIQELNISLAESTQKLIEMNAAKDKFFSIISHDLKNPFSSFIYLTDRLLNDFKSLTFAEFNTALKNLNQSANKLYKLLGNLLQWSQVQRETIQFNPDKYILKDIIRLIFDYINHAASEKNITLVNRIPDDIEIFADVNMADSIFRNLIHNSVKFTEPNGKIIVDAKLKGNIIEVSIMDTGIGIPDSMLSKLFSIEHKTSSKGTNGEEGSGLGLILCNEFVSKHGGRIRLDSQVGKGTTFYVEFPVRN